MLQRTPSARTINFRKRSPIWLLSEKEFRELVAGSSGVGQVLEYFVFPNHGRNHVTVKDRIRALEISTEHFNRFIYRRRSLFKINYSNLLTENSTAGRGHLKRFLIKEKLISYVCSECPVIAEWNGKPLVLVLDHINGVNNDHRIENLRFLCPNCNSQQPTFAGRNLPVNFVRKKLIEQRTSAKSSLMDRKDTRQKQDWGAIDIGTLYDEIGSCLGVANRLGNVSNVTVRKWLLRSGKDLMTRPRVSKKARKPTDALELHLGA